MSDLSVFENKQEETGIAYYLFPKEYPLFKATTNVHNSGVLELKPNVPYFFGLKNTNEEYIASYEKEYGIIFEYKTTRPYKLVALDDKMTQRTLYESAPENIREILENNYGYSSNIRNSVGEKDKAFARYLCSLGYDGYATNDMATDFGGKFHIELLICNVDGLDFVGQITPQDRAEYIIEDAKSRNLSKQMKEQRAENKRKRRPLREIDGNFEPRNRLFDDGNIIEPRNRLFDDEDMFGSNTMLEFGGKRRKKTKRRTNKKRRQSRKKNQSRKNRRSRLR
jgi:hypothetical protein